MTTLGFVLRMAAREVRASPRRLFLLTASVAVGVAALVAINSFTDNLRRSVREQARALLGADLSVSSRRPLPPSAEAVLDTLVRDGAELSRITSFAGMAYVPRTSGTRLVQVAAVEGDFPFYGEIRTDPAPAWGELPAGRNVVVDPALLAALSARVGDSLALGEARFRITGSVVSAPGNAGFRAALGPRIFIPARYLAETQLLGFGARAEYEAFLKLPSSASPEAIADRYRQRFRAEQTRLRTVTEDQENLNQSLSRLTGYLGLVALIALLLGGIGVASAVVVFIRQRMETIAVLRCLGATGSRVFAIYGAEAAAMGLAGSLIGAAAGAALQALLPGLLAGLLPVDVEVALSWRAVALGTAMGLWVALVFALLPLLSVRRVPPLAALRRPFESESAPRDPWRWVAFGALAASTVVLARAQVGSWRQGAIFAGAVGVVLLLLWLASWALIWAARRWLPAGWPYLYRQGLSNLHRPSNQTVTVVLAIGFGAFLLGTLVLVQFNLLRQLQLTGGPQRPNLVLFDIQPDQLTEVKRLLGESRLPSVGPVPIVPMRIATVNGRPVGQILTDTAAGGRDGPSGSWAFRREYRSTYRDTLVASERVIEGTWWGKQRAGRAAGSNGGNRPPVSISVETEVAAELGIAIGDTVVWDVQGVQLTSRVTSLREVEWARFEPNFFVVFQPGALEDAPQTLVTLTRIEDPQARGGFQRRLAERLPNVTTLDLTVLQETLERLLERIVLAEYLALGLIAAAVAAVLAAIAAWALATWVFEGRFTLPAGPLALLTLGVVGLTVVVGLLNSREVIRRTPLEVLRGEM